MSSVQPRRRAGTSVEIPRTDGVAGPVGMDPDHQRRVALVAETCALAVAAPVTGVVSGHRHAVAARQQERPRAPAIASATGASPAAPPGSLIFSSCEPGPIGSSCSTDPGRGAVTGIEADQRGGSELDKHRAHGS